MVGEFNHADCVLGVHRPDVLQHVDREVGNVSTEVCHEEDLSGIRWIRIDDSPDSTGKRIYPSAQRRQRNPSLIGHCHSWNYDHNVSYYYFISFIMTEYQRSHSNNTLRCQFHQRLSRAFYLLTSFRHLFSSYVLLVIKHLFKNVHV